jgi:hypothetical protein
MRRLAMLYSEIGSDSMEKKGTTDQKKWKHIHIEWGRKAEGKRMLGDS